MGEGFKMRFCFTKKPPYVRSGSDKQGNMQLLHDRHHSASNVPVSCMAVQARAPARSTPQRGRALFTLPQTREAAGDWSLQNKTDVGIMTHANVRHVSAVDSCRLSSHL